MSPVSRAAEDRLKDFIGVRLETLAKIGLFSQAQLDFSPRPGRWSIGEVADHLRLSELLWRVEVEELVALARAGRPARRRHSFAEINVSPLHIPTSILSMVEMPLGFMTRFVPDAVIGMFTEFPLMPTRNPDAATPRPGRSSAELIAGLQSALATTRQLIDSNADLDFEQMVSEHPLMGANNVPQILNFLARHERRHHGQIDDVRRASNFPAR